MKPGDTVAHYRILERVGAGGMGEVYRAEDLRLQRVVALKTLIGRSDGDAAARLLAEARAASVLTHPNIAVVYETSEAEHDGRTVGYIAMEFVEGHTLAELIADGPLPPNRLFDVAGQIADALEAAHTRALVHRDLKPSNVMLTPEGRVKVLDFGVAYQHACPVSPEADTRSADTADRFATFVGTLPYAAPEQATGRGVDARADIFAFGVLLFELAAGRKPFAGANQAQLLEAVLRHDPPRLANDADTRIAALDQLVRRMLSVDPERRPRSTTDVRTALDAIRQGTGAGGGDAVPSDVPPAVAVAPFANISGNAEDDWLGAGLAETLTTDAARLDGAMIVPRARLGAAAKAIHDDTGEIGDRLFFRAASELGVRWLIGGAFQRLGDAIRVTASLTDVGSGQLIGTSKVDGSVSAIFAVQDRLVREIAGTLRTAVPRAAARSAGDAAGESHSASPGGQDTRVVDAYEAFSRGLLNRSAETMETLDRAVWYFEHAVMLDPAYARAHLELGVAYGNQADYLSVPEMHARAVASLRRAVELQPSAGRAWRELGLQLISAGRHEEGLAAVQRGHDLDPDDPASSAAMGRAVFLGFARFVEAAAWFDRAFAANSKGGWYALQRAHCAALLRDFAAGQLAADRAVALQEAFLSGREGLSIAGAYIRAGHLAALQERHREAVEYFEREVDFLTRTEHPLRHRILVELNVRLGASYRALGDARRSNALFAVALESFDRRVRLGADDAFTRYYAAAVHAVRGDAEPALAFLERAASQHRAFTIARARIEPEFENLWRDPRFAALTMNDAERV